MISLFYFLIISIHRRHTDEFNSKRKRRIIVQGSVTRYGPRNQSPAQVVQTKERNNNKQRGWTIFSVESKVSSMK